MTIMSAGTLDDGLFTGLHWKQGNAFATVLSRTGQPRVEPVSSGVTVRWRVQGPRRCIGLYDHGRRIRRPCPAGRPPESGAQCRPCAYADPGRLIAQDRAAPDGTLPAGVFRVYLALFGRDTVKVGLTAQRRATDRLLEQGALAHVFLCEGPYTPIRQVERLVSSRLSIPERLQWRRKRLLWREATDVEHRATVLATAANEARGLLTGCPVSISTDEPVVDNVSQYGVAPETLPHPLRVATQLDEADVLSGAAHGVIGKMLILDTADHQLVVDTRGLEGWHISALQADAPSRLAIPPTEESAHEQTTLFSM